MFPYDDEELIEEQEEDIDATPYEWGLNSDMNAMTGVRVEDVEALKIWAYNAILTPKGRYEMFTDEYGSELEDLISHANSPGYILMEAKRMITDCVTYHPMISGISDFSGECDGDSLKVSFTLVTDYGDTEMEMEAV